MYVFGELLRGFREREGISQVRLRQALRVHRNTISAWEPSQYLPKTREMVLVLAETLGLADADRNQLLAAADFASERLPAIWNVPTRNPNFYGRQQVLGDLRQALAHGHPAALTQIITGLGGVGKTQLAIEYAHRYATDYDLIWWVRSEKAAVLAGDIMRGWRAS